MLRSHRRRSVRSRAARGAVELAVVPGSKASAHVGIGHLGGQMTAPVLNELSGVMPEVAGDTVEERERGFFVRGGGGVSALTFVEHGQSEFAHRATLPENTATAHHQPNLIGGLGVRMVSSARAPVRSGVTDRRYLGQQMSEVSRLSGGVRWSDHRGTYCPGMEALSSGRCRRHGTRCGRSVVRSCCASPRSTARHNRTVPGGPIPRFHCFCSTDRANSRPRESWLPHGPGRGPSRWLPLGVAGFTALGGSAILLAVTFSAELLGA